MLQFAVLSIFRMAEYVDEWDVRNPKWVLVQLEQMHPLYPIKCNNNKEKM